MRTLNLGILAHVDAGKTSLTERLLYAAGVIDDVGRVDHGTTRTDTLELERRRGITIKSAVVSFAIDDVTINLIDTPGHPDFIAEVERVLGVLDGAVLVVSAVEGVQPQTRVLMRTLQRLAIPTLIFVNKIDRVGARDDEVVRSLVEKLTPAVVPMTRVRRLGTRDASVAPHHPANPYFRTALIESVAEHDDEILAAYLADDEVPYPRLREALATQTRKARVHPVFFGSAITGAGIDLLRHGITTLLPTATGSATGPVSGAVFKVDRGPAGDKVAYVRMLSGTVRTRDRLRFGDGRDGRVTGIEVFDRGAADRRGAITAGQIGMLHGLSEVRIGDLLRDPTTATEGASSVGSRTGGHHSTGNGHRSGAHHFGPPTLETVVTPRQPHQRLALHTALTELAEADPLINVRQDDVRQELSVSLYGEVQKQVIGATLADQYGIDVEFHETSTICIERPAGVGAAVEANTTGRTPDHPFLATVGLRVEPGPRHSGVRFGLEVELGSMPYAYFAAVEETVHKTLKQGLYGWEVTDCVVTMTHSGYWPRQSKPHVAFDKSVSSTAGDFRNLTPLVLLQALQRAGTTVYEPIHRFRLEVPADTSKAVLNLLARLRATTLTTVARGTLSVLEGDVPAESVHALQQHLASVSRGEGVLESTFDRYEPVRGRNPQRPRTDHNPLNRKEYLLHVVRRV